ncbi:MAG: type I 3-dehydroquinate dehydratase [Deltaproteobacteria bacterium]|nr:type I 3-dehydroquinate dehydratase [Deltaproteobacteria bacterium]
MKKICVSVMVERPDQVLETMTRARDMGANLLEWRLDVTREPEVESVLRQAPLPVIATVRSLDHGGHFDGSKEEQLRLLLRAAAGGSSYVDWEFRREEGLPDELASMREQVILSYHNFQETPPENILKSLFNEMAAIGAGAVKVVTLAQEMEDNISLLNLIGQGRKQGLEVVAFCLGSLGRISRVACLLVGGAFTYAALERGAEAAPGQFTLPEMHRLLEMLQ